jgi:hypothetical protein
MQNKADAQLEATLDNNNYDESQLMSIKIPVVSLPYYTNSKKFERKDGQVEINGSTYNYVKWRLYNDTVELFCIPNRATTKLMTAKNDFFKLVNDLQHGNQSKKAVHNFLDDYAVPDSFGLKVLRFTSINKFYYYPENISSHFPTVIENPPEHC